jgi:hypothetical protein
MSNDRVKALIKNDDLSALYDNDQLNIQMVAGLAFPHYSESMITFMPTYKFDVGTTTYDTSEKARIPAWTDRILRKGSNIRQTSYYSASLTYSDHRPVFATFDCIVTIIDEARRAALSRQTFARRRADTGGSVANRSDESSDEDIIGYEPVEPGLPPASSDRRKWWIENGKPARSALAPPQQGMRPNPARPSNPWAVSEEPGWVYVERHPGASRAPSTRSLDIRSTRSPGSTPRKPLPPPHRAAEISAPPTTARPPSNSRSVSPLAQRPNSSASQRRLAPPVAKKPAHLASGASPPLSRTRSMVGVKTEFNPPPRRATALEARVPLPPPRRRGVAVGGLDGIEGEERPTMPPRLRPGVVDLLGDEGGGELEGWRALQPSRRKG